MTPARTFIAAFLAFSITGYSGAQTVRCTTWNLQWFPNGSANEASSEQQNQRIKEAADVLRPINPDIFYCRRCGITTYVPDSTKPSRQEFITSQFALHSRNRSRGDWVNNKLRSYPNTKHKLHGQNLGNR